MGMDIGLNFEDAGWSKNEELVIPLALIFFVKAFSPSLV